MRRAALILLCCLLPFAARADDKPTVVVSFSILADMVHQISGDTVNIKVLVGPNSDAHEYQPTPADARALAGANLIIINGLGFEGWMERLIASSGSKAAIAIASKGITPLTLEGSSDPHAWQSAANAEIYAKNIRDALIAAYPAQQALFTKNAAIYIQQLSALDNWVKQQVASVPESKRRVISTHDAFQYFARDYGVEFHAPIGMNTESQPTAAAIAHLIDQLRSQHINALFLENMTDSRLIGQLEKDSGAHIGGTLYSDALSAQDGPAPDYITLMRYNMTQLVAAMKANP